MQIRIYNEPKQTWDCHMNVTREVFILYKYVYNQMC